MKMKKTYMTPAVEMLEQVTEEAMLTGSGVCSENGINYGGVDVEGSQEAASRAITTMFMLGE